MANQSPGFFGNGTYQTESVDIDKNAFYNDPNKNNNQQAQGFISGVQNRQGPQAQAAQLGPAATAATVTPNQQFRADQTALVGQLADSAAGRGPSLATSTLNAANAAAAASRLASAASERGYGGGAATNRQLAYQQGGANQVNAINAAQMRLQEQQQAQQALGSVLNSARGADINEGQLVQNNNQFNATNQNQFATQNAQFQQQAALANQEAQLRAMGLNDEQIRSMLGLSSTLNQQNQQNKMDFNKLSVDQNTALQNIQANAYNNAANHSIGGTVMNGISQGAGAAASLFALSDEREKDVFSQPQADSEMISFLESIGNHKYTYKDPNKFGADDKVHFSPMAQELEKTSIGKTMVEDFPDGRKRVKFDGHSINTILAGLSLLHGKVKKLEGK